MKLRIIAAVAAAVLASAAHAEIVIGVSLGITGPGASLGVHYRNAFQLMGKTVGGELSALAKLVLSIIELVRRLLEKQALRRMDHGNLSDEEIERLGNALMKLEQKLHEMAGQFGLRPEDLNLDLGPLGRLLE